MLPPTDTITMAQALKPDNHPKAHFLPPPWYHDREEDNISFIGQLMSGHCVYCHSSNHTLTFCPESHTQCTISPSCIVPTFHANQSKNCPSANLHLTDPNDNEGYGGPEGYVGLEERDGKC
jgi:hypothetical protein